MPEVPVAPRTACFVQSRTARKRKVRTLSCCLAVHDGGFANRGVHHFCVNSVDASFDLSSECVIKNTRPVCAAKNTASCRVSGPQLVVHIPGIMVERVIRKVAVVVISEGRQCMIGCRVIPRLGRGCRAPSSHPSITNPGAGGQGTDDVERECHRVRSSS